MKTSLNSFLRAAPLWCLLLLASVACKKRTAEPAPPSVVGNWTGKYGNGTSAAPTIAWDRLTLNADGTITGNIVAIGSYAGTYNVAGTVITGTYTYQTGTKLTYSFRCDLTNNLGTMTGTWGNGANQTNGGQMVLTKQ